MVVARYFAGLGFEPDEMRFEDSFTITLGQNTFLVKKGAQHRDSATGRSDMLLIRNGQPLAIVETKRPGRRITEADRDQAISYARLLRQIAPLAIVTNGMEVRIYDVYTGQRLEESLKESLWPQGRIPDIEEDFLHEAARKLIGVNFATLMEFCSKQRDSSMADLRGSIYERKRYVPELYEPRETAEEAFERFVIDDSPCFAVISESGLGKTNVLCALAQQYGERFPALFYWAARLHRGITDAITNDFVWEFSRERHIAYVIERFDAIATAHDVSFLIFIDALDEYPGNLKQLQSELLDLVRHIGGSRIKLCLSCKAFDWEQFVIDAGATYNTLAKATFPERDEVHRPQVLGRPRPQSVGIWLTPFTERELERSWERYRCAYELAGALTGETRQECRHPFLLRLVAETYAESGQDIPGTLSHYAVFQTYWERRLAEIDADQRHYADQILCHAAETMVLHDAPEVDERTFRNTLPVQGPLADAAYASILRLQLLERRADDRLRTRLAFRFELLRPYVFTVHSRRWQHSAEYEDIIDQFGSLLSSRLGREAINFFLTVVDRGTSGLLSHLARQDLALFLRLIRDQDLQSPATSVLSAEEQRQLVTKRLVQFAATYSILIHTHFPNLADRFDPCTRHEVGLLVHWPFYAFRPITSDHPEPLLFLEDDDFRLVMSRQAPHILEDLRYGHITNSHSEQLVQGLPQRVAWTAVTEQLTKCLTEQFLNESRAPCILEEKILRTLFGRPNIGVEGSPRGLYWEHLGYNARREVYAASVSELCERVEGLMARFASSLHTEGPGPLRRWYEIALDELFPVAFHLKQLAETRTHLEPPRLDHHELFSYLETGSYERTIELLQDLLPLILDAYRAMVEHNFPSLAESFQLYKHKDAQLVVEVSHPPRTDFLQVLYLILPSMESTGDTPVLFSPWEESLSEVSPLPVRSVDNLFATGEVRVNIEGKMITDANGVFNRVRFPSRLPVTDQVYQLIANEGVTVFGGAFDWLAARFPWHSRREKMILYYVARRRSESS